MVIQRLQSLYLLISALFISFFAFVERAQLPCLILGILVAVLSLITIFKYHNLKQQATLVKILIVLNIATVITLLVSPAPHCSNIYSVLCLPIFACLFDILALRGIVKDRNLLSAADRLR